MQRQNFLVKPVANKKAVVGGTAANYRLTVLTDGLIRYEWADDGKFEDRASTFAIHRDLPVPEFRVLDTDDGLEIVTERLHLYYDKKPFSASGLSVQVRGNIANHGTLWRYGLEGSNLGGTARTLDEADGRIPLGTGVISRQGYATIDDSRSMLFENDGWVAGRRPGNRMDGYIFSYGHDFKNAIKAFYALSGPQPLLPRWALGNWWSRYYKYTADAYLELMDRFRSEGLPFSVAVLDMDWHYVTDARVRGVSGWTGYSWDRNLIAHPQKFLSELHGRDLKVTANLHPADGVQAYEDAYEEMAGALGHDTTKGDPIAFDATSRAFVNAYFDILHRRLEEDGMDFWWVDWQQGEHSKITGVDPLWVLNHFHFLDNSRDGTRPLTFSRYAGPGSHRYPVGFSGDTIVTWDSLDFQPEFTATASNIGYGWWSHDIGGHMGGYRDDELATRWVQSGVFSPIMRLHSSDNPFNTKEPWVYDMEFREAMNDALRLRHQLMPYLYTMNVRAATKNEPLVQPMYWMYPTSNEAYRARNEFYFGSELIVAPITSPRDAVSRLGKVRAWLPSGRHVDILTGAVYDGDREIWMYRPLRGYPVLAREGAIIPMDAAKVPLNGGTNPKAFVIEIVVGSDGHFEIVEDDGSGSSADTAELARTRIDYNQSRGTVAVGPTSPVIAGLPSKRKWTFSFPGLAMPKKVRILVDGVDKELKLEPASGKVIVSLNEPIPLRSIISVEIDPEPHLAITDAAKHIFPILVGSQMDYNPKKSIWAAVNARTPLTGRLSQLHALNLNENLMGAMLEYLLADSRAI